MLAMLREALEHDRAACVPHQDVGWVTTADRVPDEIAKAATEGEALAAALLAVWGEL